MTFIDSMENLALVKVKAFRTDHIFKMNNKIENSFQSGPKDVNPYPWILEKNPKCGTITERVSRKKSRAQRCVICICFCALDFSVTRSVTVPKMAYSFDQHGIFPHILAYAISNKKAQLTLYLHIWFLFSKSQLWRHKRWFWIVFSENALGDGPKHSRIRVKSRINMLAMLCYISDVWSVTNIDVAGNHKSLRIQFPLKIDYCALLRQFNTWSWSCERPIYLK